MEAFVDSSLATALLAQRTCSRSRTSNPFHLLDMEQIGGQLWIIAATFTLDLLDDQLGITFH
jgi:hypothetical protein